MLPDDPRNDLKPADCQLWLDAALRFANTCRAAINAKVSSGFDVEVKPDNSLVTSADRAAEKRFREAVKAKFPDAGIIGEEFGAESPDADLQWVIDPIDGTSEFAAGIPLYGSIIGLFYKGMPVVGVLDHPSLDLRIHAAHGLGTWLRGERVRLADLPPGLDKTVARLSMPSRVSFLKAGEDGAREDEGHIFERLSAEFPNCRTFHTCYAHVCAAAGQVDAAVEWDTRLWDVAAAQVLIEEAGGAYRLLRKRPLADGGDGYSVVFGKPSMVERIARVIEPLC